MGSQLAVAGGSGIWLYNAATSSEETLLVGHTRWVTSVAFSPDGTTLASGSEDSTVRLWDAAGTGTLKNEITGHSDFVYSVAFSSGWQNTCQWEL